MSSVNKARAETIEANGLSFHYLEWGDVRTKHAVVLLHGFAETKGIWRDAAQDMAREYRVIALDQRGHGGTDAAPDMDYSRATQVDDLEGVIEALGLRTVTLVGHATGGANALCYAAEHPDTVTALVLVETAPEVLRSGIETLRRVVASGEQFATIEEMADVFREHYPEATAEQVDRRVHAVASVNEEGTYNWDFDRVFRDPKLRPPEPDPGQRRLNDLWECADRVQCPVMIVRGAETDMLTPEAVQRLHRRITGSRVSLIEEAGHAVPTDQPAALALNVREFLQALSRAPA